MRKLCVNDFQCPPRPKGIVILEGHIYRDRIITFGGTNSGRTLWTRVADRCHCTLWRLYPQAPSMHVTLGGPEGMLLAKSNGAERAQPSHI